MSNVVYVPPLWKTLGVYKVEGDVGLEIECEGNQFKKMGLPEPWVYHEDHSLRGEDNAEYVFDGPQSFDDVGPMIDNLWGMFSDYGTILDESNRTSVHVHLNVQNWHLPRLAAFCALYFSVENVLTEWCGDHRVGNLFCMRASDAPAIVSDFKKFVKMYGDFPLSDSLHYSALNLNALFKFGSVEVRTMRGTADKDVIIRWVNILRHIYELSAEFKDPRDIPGLFSGYGPDSYLKKVIGPEFLNIRPEINMTNEEIRQETYRGIRLAQEICYAVDWNLVRPDSENPDVFRRNNPQPFEYELNSGVPSVVDEMEEFYNATDLVADFTAGYATPNPYIAVPNGVSVSTNTNPGLGWAMYTSDILSIQPETD